MMYMKKDSKFAEGLCIKKVFWIFIFGCLFGTIWEMVNHFIHYGTWVSRRALIYEPFNPVYGAGAVIFMIFLIKYKNPLKIFIGGMLLGGGFEYLCSVIQENIFGTISWDYSKHFMNINGRTTLPIMIAWGLLALLFVKVIYPFLSNKIEKIPIKIGNVITYILLVIIIIDASISTIACLRQTQRDRGYKASNDLEVFLDKHYSDDRLNKIYENKKITKR